MSRKINHPNAFSLIELSIVILIISIIISGTLTVSKSGIRSANVKITKDRMDAIYKALVNYVSINRKLPCPAELTRTNTDINFGKAVAADGACASGNAFFSSAGGAGNLAWGMVPTATLGLPNEMAADGFGTKFDYIVDVRFTKKTLNTSYSDGFEATAATQYDPNVALSSIIEIREGSVSGNILTSYAIFTIISHGANKLGGYNISGTTQNTLPSSSDELENTENTTFNPKFVNNSTDQSYDDILLFKRKPEIIMDAELEFIICPASESSLYITSSLTLTWINSYYNSSTYVSSNNKCNSLNKKIGRLCGKYGVWGAVSDVCTS